MSEVSTWSLVAEDNNAHPPNGWPEGQSAASVNNCARELMRAIRSLYDNASTTNLLATELGFKGIPQNSQSGNYTLALSDCGKEIYHPSGAGAGDTYTIPANASVPFPIGTVIMFTNDDTTNSVSIAITSDTQRLAGTSTTGTRTPIAGGVAFWKKTTATTWVCKGDLL